MSGQEFPPIPQQIGLEGSLDEEQTFDDSYPIDDGLDNSTGFDELDEFDEQQLADQDGGLSINPNLASDDMYMDPRQRELMESIIDPALLPKNAPMIQTTQFFPPSPQSRVCFICKLPPKRPTDSYRISDPDVVRFCFALPVLPTVNNRLCARHYHLLRLHNQNKTKIFPFEYSRSTTDRKRIVCSVVQHALGHTPLIDPTTGLEMASNAILQQNGAQPTPTFTIDDDTPGSQIKKTKRSKDYRRHVSRRTKRQKHNGGFKSIIPAGAQLPPGAPVMYADGAYHDPHTGAILTYPHHDPNMALYQQQPPNMYPNNMMYPQSQVMLGMNQGPLGQSVLGQNLMYGQQPGQMHPPSSLYPYSGLGQTPSAVPPPGGPATGAGGLLGSTLGSPLNPLNPSMLYSGNNTTNHTLGQQYPQQPHSHLQPQQQTQTTGGSSGSLGSSFLPFMSQQRFTGLQPPTTLSSIPSSSTQLPHGLSHLGTNNHQPGSTAGGNSSTSGTSNNALAPGASASNNTLYNMMRSTELANVPSPLPTTDTSSSSTSLGHSSLSLLSQLHQQHAQQHSQQQQHAPQSQIPLSFMANTIQSPPQPTFLVYPPSSYVPNSSSHTSTASAGHSAHTLPTHTNSSLALAPPSSIPSSSSNTHTSSATATPSTAPTTTTTTTTSTTTPAQLQSQASTSVTLPEPSLVLHSSGLKDPAPSHPGTVASSQPSYTASNTPHVGPTSSASTNTTASSTPVVSASTATSAGAAATAPSVSNQLLQAPSFNVTAGTSNTPPGTNPAPGLSTHHTLTPVRSTVSSTVGSPTTHSNTTTTTTTQPLLLSSPGGGVPSSSFPSLPSNTVAALQSNALKTGNTALTSLLTSYQNKLDHSSATTAAPSASAQDTSAANNITTTTAPPPPAKTPVISSILGTSLPPPPLTQANTTGSNGSNNSTAGVPSHAGTTTTTTTTTALNLHAPSSTSAPLSTMLKAQQSPGSSSLQSTTSGGQYNANPPGLLRLTSNLPLPPVSMTGLYNQPLPSQQQHHQHGAGSHMSFMASQSITPPMAQVGHFNHFQSSLQQANAIKSLGTPGVTGSATSQQQQNNPHLFMYQSFGPGGAATQNATHNNTAAGPYSSPSNNLMPLSSAYPMMGTTSGGASNTPNSLLQSPIGSLLQQRPSLISNPTGPMPSLHGGVLSSSHQYMPPAQQSQQQQQQTSNPLSLTGMYPNSPAGLVFNNNTTATQQHMYQLPPTQ